jgi:hypothetical protein
MDDCRFETLRVLVQIINLIERKAFFRLGIEKSDVLLSGVEI